MFIALLSVVLFFAHLYLWKRLVHDTTRPGRTRWIMSASLIALMALLVATIFAPRLMGIGESAWLAWPGYVWFGLAVYLVLSLLVLEPVRFALSHSSKRKPVSAMGTSTT